MTHDLTRAVRSAGGGLVLLLGAVLGALIAVELLLHPPASELWTLGAYMAASGIATVGLAVLAVRELEHRGPAALRTKIAAGSAVGAAVGFLNVLIVARLMFVSTSHDLRLLIALVGFSACVSFGFSLWVAATITRRLRAATTAVRSLADGDLSVALAFPGSVDGDEVAQLSWDIANLADRLRAAREARLALEREREDLTVAISHDLRTPLASIRAMTEALADGVVADDVEVQRYYATIRHEVEQVDRMVDDLFQLSRMDAGALRLDAHRVALQEIAAEVVHAMEPRASASSVRLILQVDHAVPEVEVDGALIERAIGNLVENALAHTEAGGEITVAVVFEGRDVVVRVRDTGVGISADDLARVWDRFVRVDRSRHRTSGGHRGAGLGLAIVRGVAEAHGGGVAVASTPGEGSTFSIRLPLTGEGLPGREGRGSSSLGP